MRDHDARFVDELASLHAAGGGNGRIVEVASHGGYLHDYFVERGLDSLVVEGAPALVEDLRSRGVPVVAENLGLGSVDRVRGGGPGASIVVDSYFLAHVQDPNDLMAGMRGVLAPGGRVVLEFDHVLPVIIEGQFDALRHGHLTYWSLHALDKLLRRHGLAAGSVTEQPVYGGALRVIAGAVETTSTGESVYRVLEAERAAGLDRMETYAAFEANVKRAIDRVHEFLLAERAAGRIVVGYGAPSRGATLLNAARVTPDLLPFTVDRSPVKQGRLMPGCRIPIAAPDRLREVMPDAVLILTWDIRDEVIDQQAELRAHGVHFVVAVPTLEVVAG